MPRPDSEVVRVIRAHRLSMNAAEEGIMMLMGERWLEVERTLDANIAALANEMLRRAQAGEMITESMVHRAERYQILKRQMEAEIAKYNKDAIYSSFPSTISASFNQINTPAVNSMIGFAGDWSPLSKLLTNDFGDAARGMLESLISGVAQGQSAEQVARLMAEGTGLGLDRSLLIARTELNRAYRAGSTEQYRESGVTIGFMRLVARDEACLACLALDGERFDTASEMDDHPNGRCSVVPIIDGEPPPSWEPAQEWFAAQPESVQLGIMGPARMEMYKDGMPLTDFADKAHSNEWGDSPRITPLKELINE